GAGSLAVTFHTHVAANGPGAAAGGGRGVGWDVRDGRVIDVFPPVVRRSGPVDPPEELECAVVERQDSVPLGFGPPRVDHLVELLGQLAGEVMTFREVFLEVVKRPLVLVEGGPFEVVCDGFPAVLPQPAVPELLEVLRTATGLGTGLVPSGDEAL